MTAKNMNVLDVVRFLCEGQDENLVNEIMKGVEEYWDPKSPGVGFLSFSVEVGIRKELIDWQRLLRNIETTLTDARYAEHADTIRTHTLEGLSNRVANGNLPAQILLDYAGPLSRAHMKSWELMMSGKTIF